VGGRPYGRVLNLLHHNIGSTHVVHHIDHRIPHYHAAQATKAVRFSEYSKLLILLIPQCVHNIPL
jgi:fatty acid desaturase